MTDTVIYLTRHGQTEWNRQGRLQGHRDSPLTNLGRQQAEWLKERLAGEPLEAIYSSISRRALETASILRGERTTAIQPLEELREINLGIWEGMETEQIAVDYPVAYAQFFAEPELYVPPTCPGSGTNTSSGESYRQLQERALPVIERILAAHPGQRVLVVTHRITLKVIMAYYQRKVLCEVGKLPDILPTALCKVKVSGGLPQVALLGDTSHYRELPLLG